MGLEHMMNHPAEWLSILPKKFFHLWATDWSGVANSTLPREYPPNTVNIPMMIAQAYWVALALLAALAVFTRPLSGYWLRFPTILLPMTLAYWTAFHMMFLGEGRFHMPVIPVVAIIAVHLLANDRDWKSWLPSRWRESGIGNSHG